MSVTDPTFPAAASTVEEPDEIEAEVKRLTPLVEQGGFIPFCDHRVPPDVPMEHQERAYTSPIWYTPGR